MSKCPGLHCGGCRGDGNWLPVIVGAILIAAGTGVCRWLTSPGTKAAFSEALHVACAVLTVAFWTAVSAFSVWASVRAIQAAPVAARALTAWRRGRPLKVIKITAELPQYATRNPSWTSDGETIPAWEEETIPAWEEAATWTH